MHSYMFVQLNFGLLLRFTKLETYSGMKIFDLWYANAGILSWCRD